MADLINEETGALNKEWVYQYMKDTGVGITEAFRDGMNQFIELEEKMLVFKKEFLADPQNTILQYDAFCAGAKVMDLRGMTKFPSPNKDSRKIPVVRHLDP